MSVAIYRSSSSVQQLLIGSIHHLMPTPSAAAPTCGDRGASAAKEAVATENDDEGGGGGSPPGQLDIWSSIQAHNLNKQPNSDDPAEPYVHPLTRLASGGRLLSQKSLEICTESLGSETGSDGYFSSEDAVDVDYSVKRHEQEKEEEHDVLDHDEVDDEHDAGVERNNIAVNYHCSMGRRSPSRSFPPPLPSISSRDGPCVQMRPRREDGRLVVEAVAVPSQNYLHAQRRGGRLLLSFINTAAPKRNNNININIINTNQISTPEQELELPEEEVVAVEEDEEAELEEEEEVEVVDRGTVVEVKVSTQPPQQGGGGGGSAAARVHRSSIVINKFVSCTPLGGSGQDGEKDDERNDVGADRTRTISPRRSTTAAAAAVAASSLGGALPGDGGGQHNKLLFTSKRRNREELLRDMRRCSQLRKPLFIWEPCCIATSS